MRCQILDTYPDFTEFWKHASAGNLAEQITMWQTLYMNKYPELLNKQIRCYRETSDWQAVCRRVFPQVPSRLRLMATARDNILNVYENVCKKASKNLGLNFNILFVVYVGMGCGAGWATTYDGKPTVLLGLENIAEEKWHTKPKLQGLISHEIGHLYHMGRRHDWTGFEEAEKDPLFQLYSEGFAQRCEHVIAGRETWHMAGTRKWIEWCERNNSWLAREFLNRVQERSSVNDFFGSWYSIRGRKQTGYFLGHDFIRQLEDKLSLKDIACLSHRRIRELAVQHLQSVSSGLRH